MCLDLTSFFCRQGVAIVTLCFCSRAGHPWVQMEGVAPDRPLDSAVLSRLMQFSAMNRLKKIVIRVSTYNP